MSLPNTYCAVQCTQSNQCRRFRVPTPDNVTRIYYVGPPLGAREGNCSCFESKTQEKEKVVDA